MESKSKDKQSRLLKGTSLNKMVKLNLICVCVCKPHKMIWVVKSKSISDVTHNQYIQKIFTAIHPPCFWILNLFRTPVKMIKFFREYSLLF